MNRNLSQRTALFACLISLLLPINTGSAQAAIQDLPKDICANKKTGTTRSVMSFPCSRAENSLGSQALEAGIIRPDKLHRQLAARFNAARLSAKNNGYELLITSGWRSVGHQQRLFDRAVAKYGSVQKAHRWVLPANESMHTWGLAIDIRFAKDSAQALRWFKKYSHKFGLCRVYKNEWWHFEPNVGPGQKCPALR